MEANSPVHPALWLFSYSISIQTNLSAQKILPTDAMLKQKILLD